MRRHFFRSLFWLTASNAVVKPVWFIFITYICIRAIGGEQYGIMAAMLALMSIVDGALMLGTTTYSILEVAKQKEQSSLFFSNFLVTRGALALVGIAVGLGIEVLLGNAAVLTTAALAGLYVVARSFNVFCRTFFISHEIFKREALSTVVEKILVVICGSAALIFVPTASSVLLGMAIGMILTSTVNYRWVVNEFAKFQKALLDSEFIRKSIPLAIPFGLSSLFILLFLRTDSVMIEVFIGELATAQYALAYRILEALIIVPSMIVTILLPRLSVLSTSDMWTFGRLSRRGVVVMALIGAFLASLVWAGAPMIIHVIDDSLEMLPSGPLLQVLIWSFPLSAVNYMLSTVLSAADKQKEMAVVLGAAAALNIGFNFWMIPHFGAAGAAYATIATELLVMIFFLATIWLRLPKTDR